MTFATNESHKLNRTFGLHIVDTVIKFGMNLRGALGSWRKMQVFDKFTLTHSIMQNLDTCVSFHHSLAQVVLKPGRSFTAPVVQEVPNDEYVMDDLTDAWEKQNKDKECGENVLTVLNKLRREVVLINVQAEEMVDNLKQEEITEENPLLALDSDGVGNWFEAMAKKATDDHQSQQLNKISTLVKEKQLNGLAMVALADVKLREYFQITGDMLGTVRCMLDTKQGDTEGEECLKGVVCTYFQAATSTLWWVYKKTKYFYSGVKSLIKCDVNNIALLILDGIDFAVEKFKSLSGAVPETAQNLLAFIREEITQRKINVKTVHNLLALAGTFQGDEGAAAVFSLATALAVSDLLKKVAVAWSEAALTCQAISDNLSKVNEGLE